VRLIPQRGSPALAACRPALGQVCEIRQGDPQAGLVEDREESIARPKHESGPAVGALEGGSFVAGRLVEVLVVRVHVFERVGGRKLVVFDRQLDQKRRAAVEPPPFGKADIAVIDLASFQLGF